MSMKGSGHRKVKSLLRKTTCCQVQKYTSRREKKMNMGPGWTVLIYSNGVEFKTWSDRSPGDLPKRPLSRKKEDEWKGEPLTKDNFRVRKIKVPGERGRGWTGSEELRVGGTRPKDRHRRRDGSRVGRQRLDTQRVPRDRTLVTHLCTDRRRDWSRISLVSP